MSQYINKITIITAISCLLIGRYVLQPRQKIKEVVKVVEVEKYVKEEKKKTRTETKEVIKPDGSKETNTVVVEDTASKENGSTETKIDKKVSTKQGSGITVGVMALKDVEYFSDKTELGVLMAVPVFGNVSVIGTGDTTKRIGLGLAMEF